MSRTLAGRALVAAGIAAICALVWHHMAILGDGFWTIATGRWLLAHHALPQDDPFSYASVGEGWMVVSAGACVVFAAVTRAFGLFGLMAFGTVIEVAAVGLLWLRASRTALGRLALLPFALFFVQVDAQDLSARGQLFGDLGFVLLLGVLARLRDGRRVHPIVVAVLAALWANLHLSFVIAFFLPLGAAALLWLEPATTRGSARPFVIASVAALLGTLLTPYGLAYVRFALRCAFAATAGTIDLFQSPDFHDPRWLLAPLAGALLVVARGHYGADEHRRPEQAFLLAFTLAACLSRRYATELVAVEMALLGPMIDRLEAPRVQRYVPAVAGATSAVLAVFAIVGLREEKDPLRDVPVAAARVAREAQRAQAAAGQAFDEVVDPLHWGGYLAYEWMGDPKYLVDGRDHVVLFGNGVFDDSGALRAGRPGWAEILDTYEAGTVLWERGMPLDQLLRADPRWHLVHEDAISVVYVRAK
jgi:hypothetical protein